MISEELIERIERASGPDRELAADLLRYLGWTSDGNGAIDPSGGRRASIPDYLGSIDAAMTLVPEGAGVTVERYWVAHLDEPVWSAEIVTGGLPDNPRRVFDHYEAPSPALALCAAALRARAALAASQNVIDAEQ